MDFSALVIATAMVWTAVSILKLAKAGQWNDVLTVAVVIGVGIGAAFLLRGSDFAESIKVGGHMLKNLNTASVILFGYGLGSTARSAYEFKKSFDSSQSAAEPKLFPPPNVE